MVIEIVSGMATLLHDPFGVESAGNAIERVKFQYVDPVTGLADASKSEFISMTDWISHLSERGHNLGLFLQPFMEAADAPGLVVDGVVVNYDAYNAIMTGLRARPNLAEELGGTPDDPQGPLLAGLVTSLPTTSELGLPTHQSVQDAWAAAAGNLDLIG